MGLGILDAAKLLVRGQVSFAARARRTRDGIRFAKFARRVGIRGLLSGDLASIQYLISPVSSVRYWEFPFVLECLPAVPGEWLDVSSPRMFALELASSIAKANLRMINPDPEDIHETIRIVQAMKLGNVSMLKAGVDCLPNLGLQFDAIWAISVVEHIAGGTDDAMAMSLMYQSLRPGGRLIVTVPVDRVHWDEYRDSQHYGTQPGLPGKYFFQRYYDQTTLASRLIAPLAVEPSKVRWFGEKVAGWFRDYEKRWIASGYAVSVHDPVAFLENFSEFPSWEAMPGMGVCGLMFERPAQ